MNLGLDWFNDSLKKKGITEENPFYLGDKFGLFEVLTVSFLDRLRYTLDYFKGFKIPKASWPFI